MKKIWKKLLSGFLLGMGILAFTPTAASAQRMGLDLIQLQRKYPNGAYWNHVVKQGHTYNSLDSDRDSCNNPNGYTWKPCTMHFHGHFTPQELGWHDCNRFGGSIQCRGFASKLVNDVYGDNFYFWKSTKNEIKDIKPGDIIWYYTSESSVVGHQVMVIDVDSSKVCVGECNWYRDCMITWGRWFDLQDPNEVYRWTIYHAPYELPMSGNENLIRERKADVNQDGARTMEDARLVLRFILNMETMDLTKLWCADMDGDGKVTLNDVQFILKNALQIDQIEDKYVAWETEQQNLQAAFHSEFFQGIPEEDWEAYYWEHEDEYYEQWYAYYEKNHTIDL